MIADTTPTLFESAVKLVFAPVWLPIYGVVKLVQHLKGKRRTPEVQTPDEASVEWRPVTDLERTVYAAMILAGRPVTNAELARFMRCSPGEASKRVKALEGVIRKERIGREVRLSLPQYH